MRIKKKSLLLTWLVLLAGVLMAGCSSGTYDTVPQIQQAQQAEVSGGVSGGVLHIDAAGTDIPAYSGVPYVAVNDNIPVFSDSDMTTVSYETYGELDDLGRCTAAMANIGQDLMPVEKRGNISQVKPTGWQSVQYDQVDGKSLYNRCHLIGFQLTGENANEKNLITGTRYMNVEGMLPFEDMVADYVKETNHHVLYRVTPIFEGDNLVASGVQMEAKSVEDDGDGILFNVYVYNVQPKIVIDYATGDSYLEKSDLNKASSGGEVYILNTNSKKFHYPFCSGAERISDANREKFTGSREELISEGYAPCGTCKP